MKRPDVEPWLQANMAALVVAGSASLDLGQQTVLKSVVTGACAIAALVLTDWLGIFRLHRMLANLAALVALGYGTWEFWGQYIQGLDPVRQLLSIANLLIYLQIILLFQKKDVRKYWLLAVLSLLEIVVASALNLGVEFGILLVVYLALAASGMALFFVYRESLRLAGDGSGMDGEAPPSKRPREPAMFVRRETISDVQGRLMSVRLYRPALAMGACSLALGAVVFLSLPRMDGQSWQGKQVGPGASIGFTEQISLDEMTPLLSSDEKVMRISFSDIVTRQPFETIGNPYLRGAVLTRYIEDENGRPIWLPPSPVASRPGDRLPPAPIDVKLVRQDVQLEPTDSRTLFSAFEAYKIEDTSDQVRVLHDVGVLLRSKDVDERPETFRYVVGVSGFDLGRQDPITPVHPDVSWNRRFSRIQTFYFERNGLLSPFGQGQDGYARFSRLAETARKALEDADAVDGLPEEKARVLMLHFLQTGDYTYSTDFSKIQRDPTLDPLEDFVVNHRTGHCEYYAGALCLMLRSQGIPARIVVGYRPEEYNQLGSYFQVRQRDAHAWVEALFWPHEMATDAIDSDKMIGAYVRLDPTPIASSDNLAASDSWIEQGLQVFDYAQLLWTDYVISMNSETQRKTLFDPLSDNTSEAVDRWGVAPRFQSVVAFFTRFGSAALPAGAAIVALVGAAAYLVRRRGPRDGRRRRRVRGLPDVETSAQTRSLGRFFTTLAELLEAIADERHPDETVAEWIARARAVWRTTPGAPTAEPAFDESLSLYYERRFGTRRIDEERAADLRRRLEASREAWHNRKTAPISVSAT